LIRRHFHVVFMINTLNLEPVGNRKWKGK
jgi:hypothetical protein